MDELELWSAALNGDDSAFARLFRAHQGRVVRHAAFLTSGRRDAEDIAAVAFFELWRLRRRVRTVDGSVLPWLLATATNVARNATRATRRYERMLRSLPHGADESEDPADVISSQPTAETVQLVRIALRSLAPQDSTLLILTVLDGLSAADAARALGMEPTNARVRLHRAKAAAREILKTPEVTA
jgi:RNA polymerase sigma-70 factor (ECF subfamily)